MGPAVPSGCPGEDMAACEVYSLPAWPARGSCFQQPHGKCKRSPQSPVVCGKVGRPEGRVWSGPHWGGCQGSGCSPEAGKGGHSPWPLTSGSFLIPWEAEISRPLQLENVNWENVFTKPCSFPVQIVFCSNPKRVF